MKITSIPQLYRNVNRVREVVGVLIKYGLADWLSHVDIGFLRDLLKDQGGQRLARQRRETRIRLALAELGPTFIKLGQILSTRPDLVGVDLAEELRHLQSDTPADPIESIRSIVERELDCPIAEVYAEFEDEPIASASIGQVHRARLRDGTKVAVKVQHAGIQDKIRVDTEILAGFAELVDQLPEFKNYRPKAVVEEFRRTIHHELDFSRELRHAQQFTRNLTEKPGVHIARTYPDCSTSRVLTMEFLDGIKLADSQRLVAAGYDLQDIARRGADLYLHMIFVDGLYHADPHPGNVLVLGNAVIGLLDFGMVGQIDEALREDFEEALFAIITSDAPALASVITRLGAVPPDLDRAALSVEVSDFVAHYTSQRLDEFNLSGALNEMTEIIRRYQIMLPARIAMLLKVLVMLEGTGRRLHPDFNLVEVIKPYQSRLAWARRSPARLMRKYRRIYTEFEHLLRILPGGLIEIVEQIQSGKFDIHLDHRGLEPSVNRLVLGMLSSALFLGSALLLSRDVGPVLGGAWCPGFLDGTSLPGLLGVSLAFMLGLRLIRAINKSGHLDRK